MLGPSVGAGSTLLGPPKLEALVARVASTTVASTAVAPFSVAVSLAEGRAKAVRCTLLTFRSEVARLPVASRSPEACSPPSLPSAQGVASSHRLPAYTAIAQLAAPCPRGPSDASPDSLSPLEAPVCSTSVAAARTTNGPASRSTDSSCARVAVALTGRSNLVARTGPLRVGLVAGLVQAGASREAVARRFAKGGLCHGRRPLMAGVTSLARSVDKEVKQVE